MTKKREGAPSVVSRKCLYTGQLSFSARSAGKRGINQVKPLKGFTLPTNLTGRSPHPFIAGGVEPLRGSTFFNS